MATATAKRRNRKPLTPEQRASRRARLQQNGQCDRCGNPSAPYFLCPACQAKKREYVRGYRIAKRSATLAEECLAAASKKAAEFWGST